MTDALIDMLVRQQRIATTLEIALAVSLLITLVLAVYIALMVLPGGTVHTGEGGNLDGLCARVVPRIRNGAHSRPAWNASNSRKGDSGRGSDQPPAGSPTLYRSTDKPPARVIVRSR